MGRQRCSRANEPVIETYNDHRMAMSFAPACIPLVVYYDDKRTGVVSKILSQLLGRSKIAGGI
jgi:5-enolpyruvylshikimate-3-phosphate synthase